LNPWGHERSDESSRSIPPEPLTKDKRIDFFGPLILEKRNCFDESLAEYSRGEIASLKFDRLEQSAGLADISEDTDLEFLV